MIKYEGEYLGFTFDGHHSSEFGLLVVSDGSRYHQNLSSEFSDTILQVPGRNGGYYFGTQLNMRNFQLNCVYEEMTTHMMHKIQRWLYPNKIGWLIFDETPYKKYLVKISNMISLDFIPFDKIEIIKNYTIQKEILKGEINISFLSFEEYGYGNENYEIPNLTTSEVITQQIIDSGILPSNYAHNGIFLPHEQVETIPANITFEIYNAGNGIADADFYFTINADDITDNNPLEIFNYDDGETYIITNPLSVISANGYSIPNNAKYRIKISGKKKEIWLDVLNSNNEIITTNGSINIGNCYNHYFPHIHHIKPTEIMIMSIVNEGTALEPLFYQYSYENKNIPSDDSKIYSFEELQSTWSDYSIVTKERVYYNNAQQEVYGINSILNHVFGFLHYDINLDNIQNELVYLIYPNKFICNKTLNNFRIEYEYTYI